MKIVLYGPPATKKTHPIVTRARTKQGMPIGRTLVLPSESFTNWHRAQLRWKDTLKSKFRELIPITGFVSVKALIYRVANDGDWMGFAQAIADTIQAERWTCQNPNKALVGKKAKKVCGKNRVGTARGPCGFCGWPEMKRTRDGLNLILDDRQIAHWDGTRLKLDPQNPRVVMWIENVDPVQEELDFQDFMKKNPHCPTCGKMLDKQRVCPTYGCMGGAAEG